MSYFKGKGDIKMNKSFVIALASFVILSSSFTAEAHHGRHRVCDISGCELGECFMDLDGDGICGDHCFVDENGDGICDEHCYYDENGDNICDLFIDDNGDGICDHCHDHGRPAVSTSSTTYYGHHGSHHGCRW